MPFGHASVLLLGKGNEATEPYSKYTDLFKYYSETSHLLFGDKVIQSQEGCQQGDPEGPSLFSDTIQDLVNQMVSQ